MSVPLILAPDGFGPLVSPGDTLVLYDGRAAALAGAHFFAYDGTPESLTIDPDALGFGNTMTLRTLKGAIRDQPRPAPARLGASLPVKP